MILLKVTVRRHILGLVSALFLTACGERDLSDTASTNVATSPAQATASQISASSLSGTGAAYRIYVTNELAGTMTIVDGTSHRTVTSLALGKRPRGIKVSPDGKLLYVALSGSPVAGPGVDENELPPADKKEDGIGVVDIATGSMVRVLKGVSDPEQLAVSLDGRKLYIASEDTGTAIVMDAQSGRVITSLPVGDEPEGVTISPDGSVVYMTSEEAHQVSVIDTRSDTVVKRFNVGLRPRSCAFSADSSRAYVTAENDGTVSVVDTSSHEVVHTIKLEGNNPRPMGAVVSPDGGTVYVTTGRGGTVVAIDTRTYQQRVSPVVGARPWGIDRSPDGRLVFTANGPSNDVSVIDADSLAVLTRISVGERPWGVVAVSFVMSESAE